MRRLSKLRQMLLACVASFSLSNAIIAAEPESSSLKFEQHIRPILREYCFDCHGAQPKFEGNLDLRLVRFIEKGGDSGPAITKGSVEESLLVKMVASGDMPPGEARVPEEKVELIRKWLAGGAPTARPEPESIGPGIPLSEEDRQYWAYRPLTQPQLPALKADVDLSSIRTPIDHWLQAAMPEGLTFSPEASRRQLVLRAYFDLIGLPPSNEELQRWTSDTSDLHASIL